jgi:hypothetical protein
MISSWKDIDGWFTEEEANAYNNIVNSFERGNFIEIGVWKGKSFASVINSLINKNYRNIYVADHWEGSEMERDTHHREVNHTDIFKIFSNNLTELGFNNQFNILKMDSISASLHFSDNFFDVIFIDADHEYDGVKKDLIHWYPKLKTGGILCGHDYHKNHPGVQKAIVETFGINYRILGGTVWYHKKGFIINY